MNRLIAITIRIVIKSFLPFKLFGSIYIPTGSIIVSDVIFMFIYIYSYSSSISSDYSDSLDSALDSDSL